MVAGGLKLQRIANTFYDSFSLLQGDFYYCDRGPQMQKLFTNTGF